MFPASAKQMVPSPLPPLTPLSLDLYPGAHATHTPLPEVSMGSGWRFREAILMAGLSSGFVVTFGFSVWVQQRL